MRIMFSQRYRIAMAAVLACIAATVATCWSNGALGDEAPHAAKTPQVIVLKLDDVLASKIGSPVPVPPRWQRIADFLERSNLKASFGIIGSSLEQDNPAYFDWIKNQCRSGRIEFWNHGYKNRGAKDKIGEFEGSLEEQTHALQRTQKLAREKLGIELKAFGAHWSLTGADTAKALDCVPEITMVYYDPKQATVHRPTGTVPFSRRSGENRDSPPERFVFPRIMVLENPIFVPDFNRFKQIYEKVGHDKPCLALQGHPNAWDEKRWQGFVDIVEFLKSKGCVFMTPSEYLATTKKTLQEPSR